MGKSSKLPLTVERSENEGPRPISWILVALYLAVCAASYFLDHSLMAARFLLWIFAWYWLLRLLLKLPRQVWFAMNFVIVISAGIAVGILRDQSSPSDPNDPNEVGAMQPTVMRRNLKQTSDAANFRVGKGEMSRTEAKSRVSAQAEEMLKAVKLEAIPDGELWEYGEILWTAREWDKAIPVLEKAVKVAKTEDRRINDSLRLAKCYAATGQVDKAIEATRTTFSAKPEDRAPLLLAITKEIVPEARSKGKDEELAKLIEEAIPLYDATVVDTSTEAGRNFMQAKRFHISDAWSLVADLRRKRA